MKVERVLVLIRSTGRGSAKATVLTDTLIADAREAGIAKDVAVQEVGSTFISMRGLSP
jgi:hypothetical protein